MLLSLKDKTAIVCGSTQGIGKAAAVEISRLGAKVVLVSRDNDRLKEVRDGLFSDDGQKHCYICADFTNPEELKQKVEQFVARNGPVHILVNNTGGPPGGPVLGAKTEEFMQAFSNHLICNHILVQTVVEGMKSSGYGRIINIISTSVKQPISGLGVSNTIRGAVASWAKTLAGELGSFGITVNNVLPGYTDTNRLKSLFEKKAERLGKTFDEIKTEAIDSIPAGRLGEPFEIANAIAFLASPAASYINGVSLPVDGGRLECL